MKSFDSSKQQLLPNLPRRRFMQGLAAGGLLLGLSPHLRTARAQGAAADGMATGTAPVLTGTEFDLTLGETPANFTGAPRTATTVNDSLPAPTLRWREGDTVTIRVTNRLPALSSIHWHGIILPYDMDGVPGISYKGIAPGETFVYRFKVRQSGTYWYHAHTLHEQTGLYGAIIIDPVQGDPVKADRDHVILLSDWTDEDPLAVLTKLKKQSDYYNFNQPTAKDFFQDVTTEGFTAAIGKRRMWNRMRMNPTDLADVSGYTYTYLMNGTTPAGNWTGLFRPGERVRLRFINAGTASFFDVRIPGLPMTVVQTDGQNVEPVTVEEMRMGPGETYDLIVKPVDDAYTVFAQSADRSGFARGTLATRAGLTAEVPALDAPEWLTMTDMMGEMGRGDMAGMQHGGHGGMAMASGAVRVRHATTEYGPSVDMRVDTPRTNLDDPGIGLRNSGRRVLTYADLYTLGGALDSREPEREIELHLTGNMERYTWSIDGLELGKSTPVHFRKGERLRVILHNDTMMIHPMHLHGMWSEMETPEGDFLVRKHTISVQPAQRITFSVTADAPGQWAWHCHLLYHMAAGMFRVVTVA
ncbi:copper resistance protein CopA [Candidatus Tenderia electrophaga]|jgi:CopA family copper-resistance protein|uniref:Copper resistance protein CopA n=1 Tax=Candidatus Tenderia electrophaga TaxID=1748243 RepID=A0A0S2TF40_9GAMM|nr:copper resistance protein CopA [Candidatus Tenderia electrophaga]